MPEIKIPDAYKRPLSLFAGLTAEKAASLVKSLKKSKPAYSSGGLVSQIATEVDISRADLSGILDLLISLLRWQDGTGSTIEAIAQEVAKVAAAERLEGLDRDLAKTEAFEKRLIEFLSLDQPLRVTSRASNVYCQQKNLYQSSRILSDVRAVFSGGDLPEPLAATVIHNLEIVSRTDRNVLSTFFALDNRDLRELKGAIERALSKEESLRKFIEGGGLTYIGTESE